MEMRITEFNKKEIEINFYDFEVNMLKIIEEEDGVALIDIDDNEKYYIGKEIKNIFEIINNKAVKKISYIDSDSNKIKINQFYITLLNNKKYTVELL